MNRYLLFAIVMLPLMGCATRPEETFTLSPTMAQDSAARIVVYRPQTSYHRANPELPFVFVDGTQAGKLSIGSAINIVVPPGEHTIAIKEPVLFMPAYESKTTTVNTEAGGTHYVRYTRELGGGLVLPHGPTALFDKTGLDIVTEDVGKARQ